MKYIGTDGSYLHYGYTYTVKGEPHHFDIHCHKSYELLYVRRGSGKYVVEGAEYPLRSHTLLLTHPHQYHYVCPDKDSEYERFVINFDKNSPMDIAAGLSILQTNDDTKHGVYFSEEQISPLIRKEFATVKELEGLFKDHNDNSIEGSMLRTSLTRILLLLSSADLSKEIKYEENIITRVTEYLDLHLTEDISLDKLAQQFFVSKYYLCHAFRRQNGTSILAYLTVKRIALAKRLLLLGEPATSVAYQVGFHNYSSFYRAYVKQTGQAPADYKK